MVQFRPAARELVAKIVYYGPPLGGKTTNLRKLWEGYPDEVKGELIVLPTGADRTIYFDYLPLTFRKLRGLDVKIQLYTVPGQVRFDSTRQVVLKGVDGVVFVADSQREVASANLESWVNLKKNLTLQGLFLDKLPHVLQYNKRDVAQILPVEELDAQLNEFNAPFFEAVAVQGIGVEETLQGIVRLVIRSLRNRFNLGSEVPTRPQPVAGDMRASQVETPGSEPRAVNSKEVTGRVVVRPFALPPAEITPPTVPVSAFLDATKTADKPTATSEVSPLTPPMKPPHLAVSPPSELHPFVEAEPGLGAPQEEPFGKEGLLEPRLESSTLPEAKVLPVTDQPFGGAMPVTAPEEGAAKPPEEALWPVPEADVWVPQTSTELPEVTFLSVEAEAPPQIPEASLGAPRADAQTPEYVEVPNVLPQESPEESMLLSQEEEPRLQEQVSQVNVEPFGVSATSSDVFSLTESARLPQPELAGEPQFAPQGQTRAEGEVSLESNPTFQRGGEISAEPFSLASAAPLVGEDVFAMVSAPPAEPVAPTVALERVLPRAVARHGELRELEVEVPVPAVWVGGRRVTLQLRLVLVPEEETP